MSPSVPPSVLEDPSPNVHEPFYTAVDVVTGDVYWTEGLSFRVLVMRANASVPSRLAGNGAQGIDAGGTVGIGAVALNTALAAPHSITLDAQGLPVFLDGYAPGRILRISVFGVLEMLVKLTLSSSISALLIDGPLNLATAYTLSGLAFIGNGSSTLLVADSAGHSVVRRIDLELGVVSTFLGSQASNINDSQDGSAFSSANFGDVAAIAISPGGSIVLADAGANILRIAIAEDAVFVSVLLSLHLICRRFPVLFRLPARADSPALVEPRFLAWIPTSFAL